MASPMAVDDATPQLPSAWNPLDKSPLLEVSQQVRVKYLGSGDTDKDAASVRANCPIPASCGVFYFEIKIINKGRDGYIGIGLCGPNTNTNRLPGWEKNSYGYHGDDGHSFCCSGSGTLYGPTFSTGDVIGCCVNFLDCSCFYTKNGKNLGIAFRNLGGKDNPVLYPCVGLRTPHEEVEANFGQQKFVFDIDSFRAELEDRARKMVEETPLGDPAMQPAIDLVVSYLVHHGYSETALKLAENTRHELTESRESIANRKRIRDFVTSGQIDSAIQEVQKHYPTLWQARPDLLFQLECQRFVEMVAAQTESGQQQSDQALEELMAFGRKLQQSCMALTTNVEESRALLQEIFSLLAYQRPSEGPLQHLLQPARREPLALKLNSAILVSMNLPSEPPLENVVRQAATCLSHMRRLDMGAAAFLSVDQFLA